MSEIPNTPEALLAMPSLSNMIVKVATHEVTGELVVVDKFWCCDGCGARGQVPNPGRPIHDLEDSNENAPAGWCDTGRRLLCPSCREHMA